MTVDGAVKYGLTAVVRMARGAVPVDVESCLASVLALDTEHLQVVLVHEGRGAKALERLQELTATLGYIRRDCEPEIVAVKPGDPASSNARLFDAGVAKARERFVICADPDVRVLARGYMQLTALLAAQSGPVMALGCVALQSVQRCGCVELAMQRMRGGADTGKCADWPLAAALFDRQALGENLKMGEGTASGKDRDLLSRLLALEDRCVYRRDVTVALKTTSGPVPVS